MLDAMHIDFFTDGDVFINRCPVQRTSLHSHDFLEIALVEEGRGRHLIGGVEVEVQAGDYFIIDRNVPHQFSSGQGMVVCNCIFTPRFLDLSLIGIDDFRQLAKHYPYSGLGVQKDVFVPEFRFQADDTIRALFDEMYREFEAQAPGYLRILQADIQKLVVLSLRQTPLLETGLPVGAEETYGKMINFVRSHYDQPLTLEGLARMAYVSPEHFSRQFHHFTGKTVMQYVREVRMEAAGRLLIETDLPLDQIAQKVGYHDTRHFARLFRRQTGTPPIRYRKQNPL